MEGGLNGDGATGLTGAVGAIGLMPGVTGDMARWTPMGLLFIGAEVIGFRMDMLLLARQGGIGISPHPKCFGQY